MVEPEGEVEIISGSNPEMFDVDAIYGCIKRSYWGMNRTREITFRSIEHSLCFQIKLNGRFAGFARVVTDYATFVYLCDVIIHEDLRGRGLSKRLLQSMVNDPRLKDLDWSLKTRDAHSLYEKFGFKKTDHPERILLRYPRNR